MVNQVSHQIVKSIGIVSNNSNIVSIEPGGTRLYYIRRIRHTYKCKHWRGQSCKFLPDKLQRRSCSQYCY